MTPFAARWNATKTPFPDRIRTEAVCSKRRCTPFKPWAGGLNASTNVTAETFAAASELASYGASVQALNFDLFRQVSRARIVLEGEICSGLKFYQNDAIVVATVTLDMMKNAGATENDCDDIAGIPGRVEGCVVSMVIRELTKGKCKVSVRSQPDFDSSALCAVFGGGGHKMASGCTINADPDTVRQMMIDALDKLWD